MTTSDARDKVKLRLDIDSADTTFDTDIDGFVTEVVNNLYPVLQEELDPDTSATLTKLTTSLTIPAGIEEVRWIELYDDALDVYQKYDDYYHHAGKLHFNETFNQDKTVKIYGLGRYAIGDLPTEYDLVVVYWAVSEFYANLVGNKRKYNVYSQSTGVRGVDNMRDMSDYYLDRGNQILMDRVQMRGY